jgi:hypothetical protein
MSKSPLAGAFAEGSTPEKKKNKKGAALLIIAGIGLTASVGGVFAANSITINSGAAIQFGQGLAETNSCVSALTTSLTQEFVNGSNSFIAKNVVIGGTFTNCASKSLKVDLRTSAGVSRKALTLPVVASGASGLQINTTDTTKTVDVSADTIAAGDIAKITVTTE